MNECTTRCVVLIVRARSQNRRVSRETSRQPTVRAHLSRRNRKYVGNFPRARPVTASFYSSFMRKLQTSSRMYMMNAQQVVSHVPIYLLNSFIQWISAPFSSINPPSPQRCTLAFPAKGHLPFTDGWLLSSCKLCLSLLRGKWEWLPYYSSRSRCMREVLFDGLRRTVCRTGVVDWGVVMLRCVADTG